MKEVIKNVWFVSEKETFTNNLGTNNNTKISVVEDDTFSYAEKRKEKFACLNFASYANPGGGYRGRPFPQEENLFCRSNLPELMDNKLVKKYYPLATLESFVTFDVKVNKNSVFADIEEFLTDVISMPALQLVGFGSKSFKMTRQTVEDVTFAKMKRIFDIAAHYKMERLILGAWGCGAYCNDPEDISQWFKYYLENEFKGVFKEVVFAIPDKKSENFQIFEKNLK